MGAVFVAIEKTKDGESWVNTWGVATDDNWATHASIADISTIVGGNAVDWNNPDISDPGSPQNLIGTNILASLLAFERTIHIVPITITNAYVTDGRKDTNIYQTIPLSLPATGVAAGGEASIAPGNVTLMINRVPALMGYRPGRLFMRGVLDKSHVIFSGVGGIGWVDADMKEAWTESLADITVSSGLKSWFYPPDTGEICLAIPQYGKADTPDKGQLVAVVPMAGLVPVAPVSRQVKKGRRKRA